jgi:S-adenosylmethionine:tRNA ribosyltransferase-isomerase
MKTELFDYQLPADRIAQRPAGERDDARLLVLARDSIAHARVADFAELVPAGALVVVNDTRVRKARLFGKRVPGGGRVELLLLDRLDVGRGTERWSCLARANRPLRTGARVALPGMFAEVVAPEKSASGVERESGGTLEVSFTAREGEPLDVERRLAQDGVMPLPPYVRRPADETDEERYQTIYAERPGSAAAPTAGLHISRRALERLHARQIAVEALTLEVGLGTFRVPTVDDLDEHAMHEERFEVSEQLALAIRACRARGAPVVAVGTTVVRALESARDKERPGEVAPSSGKTRLLIQPGYAFGVVDGLLTNFHVPKSTLLALVCAFAGRERVLEAYREALRAGYRFLSYGDAMWIPERARP